MNDSKSGYIFKCRDSFGNFIKMEIPSHASLCDCLDAIKKFLIASGYQEKNVNKINIIEDEEVNEN